MRLSFFAGVLLVVIGIAAFSYQGMLWFRGREQVARIGPVEVTRERDYGVPVAPIVGGLAIVAGASLMVVSANRTV